MFYDIFLWLCEQKGVSPNRACVDCGISRTAVAKWRRGATPNGATLMLLAEYFGVTMDYLLGYTLQAQLDGTRRRLKQLRRQADAAAGQTAADLADDIRTLERSCRDLTRAMEAEAARHDPPAPENQPLSFDDFEVGLLRAYPDLTPEDVQLLNSMAQHLNDVARKRKHGETGKTE